MKDIIYVEVDFADGYSICIKCRRNPTIEEVRKWVAKDIEKFGDVTEIFPGLTEEEAHKFYEFDKNKEYPIFG